jgi:hypothetical protein
MGYGPSGHRVLSIFGFSYIQAQRPLVLFIQIVLRRLRVDGGIEQASWAEHAVQIDQR